MTGTDIEQILSWFRKTVTTAASKDEIREFYAEAREKLIYENYQFLATTGPKIVEKYFANGEDINVSKIDPELVHVSDEETNSIFKTARFWWSLPYTEGYGRRLRFLVMDRYNNKLIGILGCSHL